jgi:hypothetical protein
VGGNYIVIVPAYTSSFASNPTITFSVDIKVFPEIYPKGNVNIINASTSGNSGYIFVDRTNRLVTYNVGGIFYVKKDLYRFSIDSNGIRKSNTRPVSWVSV